MSKHLEMAKESLEKINHDNIQEKNFSCLVSAVHHLIRELEIKEENIKMARESIKRTGDKINEEDRF